MIGSRNEKGDGKKKRKKNLMEERGRERGREGGWENGKDEITVILVYNRILGKLVKCFRRKGGKGGEKRRERVKGNEGEGGGKEREGEGKGEGEERGEKGGGRGEWENKQKGCKMVASGPVATAMLYFSIRSRTTDKCDSNQSSLYVSSYLYQQQQLQYPSTHKFHTAFQESATKRSKRAPQSVPRDKSVGSYYHTSTNCAPIIAKIQSRVP